jgi:hypothetical protein
MTCAIFLDFDKQHGVADRLSDELAEARRQINKLRKLSKALKKANRV